MASIAVSAPGKVLLAGGYLVLDRNYTGLVFGLSARIHVHAGPVTTLAGVSLSEITVRSPQFLQATWTYGYRISSEGGSVQVTQLTTSSSPRNGFVETALRYALTYIVATDSRASIGPATFTILADDEYYSHSQHRMPVKDAESQSRFSDFGVSLSNAHKTGLGSSAALVTAFTAAVLTHYLPKEDFDLSSLQSRTRLHNIAQAAHCAAQGKVGSGFDIAAAVYGSCIYRRFSASVLDNLERDPSTFATSLKQLVDDSESKPIWDTVAEKDSVRVPTGLRFVMCDVDCGTQTVGMVKKVLEWRKSSPEEAKELWDGLQTKNDLLRSVLARLSDLQHANPTAYSQAMSRVVSGSNEGAPLAEIEVVQLFEKLEEAIRDVRSSIRRMSSLSGAPVEPPPQTKLIDACSEVAGIAGGVVPGAGGYDAIVLVVIDHPHVFDRLGAVLSAWNSQAPTRTSGGGGNEKEPVMGTVKILGVREELDGVRIETKQTDYLEWL